MPPTNKPKQATLLPEAIEQAMQRVYWLEAICMSLAAAADTSRTNIDLPHIASNLGDLGAHLAGETLTLLANFDEGGQA